MIDYYFSLRSPWAYLGHQTFIAMTKNYGLSVRYFPVFLSDVFQETGGLPLAKRHPARQNYRILELQRWREKRNLPLVLHPAFMSSDPRLADRVIIALMEDKKDPEAFIQAGFEALWVQDQDIADHATLTHLLNAAGFDADHYLARAQSESISSIHDANARQAIAAGVIGSPCYVRKGEVFWGQDRLELLDDALRSKREPYRLI